VGTLQPGVYRFNSSAQLTGTLTLDALSNPNGLFVFQIATTLITASNSIVNVLNGGTGTGIFWQVGSAATLGTGSVFAGNIVALQGDALTTGGTGLCGRFFSLNGAVTLNHDIISNDCVASSSRSDFGSHGFSGGAAAAVPEPGTAGLMSITLAGFAGLIAVARFRARHA
jgi:hypothetical protein